jgi:F-type H+-transporting ATPase subunit b
MSLFATLLAAEDPSQTHHWLFPETAELIYGISAAAIVIGVLVWKAGPIAKKAMKDRTQRIQNELDGAVNDLASAEAEATSIRTAKGDIEAERARLLAEADVHAQQLLVEGRERLEAELRELEAKTDADIAAIAARSGDELRAEIGELAGLATERLVADHLDDATQQQLIDQFIARVGASR